MKVLIPIVIGMLVVGCGHSTETIEANVQNTIQTKYDSDPTTRGAIIDNVDLKKAGGNKYKGFIHIIEADGSRMKLGLEVTVDGDVFKWTVKPPRGLTAKTNSKPEPKPKQESAKVIETAIRKAAEKPTGELTKMDLEKVRILTIDSIAPGNHKLTSAKGLENLAKLEKLHLGNNKLTDVKGLENLTQLTELWLNGNKLTDVKGLENLTQLEKLSIQFNQLTDVKGLEKLTQLKFLNLYGNQLTDVKGFEKLTQLTHLILVDNPDLTKSQIAELQKTLPKCKISHDAKK